MKAEVIRLHFHDRTISKEADVKERDAYPGCVGTQEGITMRSNWECQTKKLLGSIAISSLN